MPRTRNTLLCSSMSSIEASRAPYASFWPCDLAGGSMRHSSSNRAQAMAAETKYTARQSATSATTPDRVRASSKPITTPPCAMPTTLPRSWLAAALAA
ncbi:hypothetical protein D3C72_1936020 [compost metagenome]